MTFESGSSANPQTFVEISVSCKNLADMDFMSKSDPVCVLYLMDPVRKDWVELGRTETIMDNLNPEFLKKFEVAYRFEERQELKFSVHDIDDFKSKDLSKQDFIGDMRCTMGEIVSARVLKRELSCPGKTNRGMIISVVAEEKSGCKECLRLRIGASKLKKRSFFSNPAAVLSFIRIDDSGQLLLTDRTEKAQKSTSPNWRVIQIPLGRLSRGNRDLPFLIKCTDANTENEMGSTRVTADQLLQMGRGGTLTLKSPKGEDAGTLVIQEASIVHDNSFLDYIDAGMEIACVFAIDFTASNGNPKEPRSLHYFMDQNRPNPYLRALRAVGEVVQDYDSDKLFPVYGFGARLPPTGQLSHMFHVNLQQNPDCHGIDQILAAYYGCIQQIQLYGPTNFSPIINEVARKAGEKTDGSEYYVLLIITDGIITDMGLTKDAVISAATLPLSIIIVGVGEADFSAMHELDGDEVRLNHNGRVAARDIVQFVEFNEFISKSHHDLNVSQVLLARAVLEEIPDQITSYMKSRNIAPGSWPGARPLHRPGHGEIAAPFVPTVATIPAPEPKYVPTYGGQGAPPYPSNQASAPYPNGQMQF